MSRSDSDCLLDLIRARHAAIYIPTYEEDYALETVRGVASERTTHFLVWSVTRGLYDGLLQDEATIPDTSHPAGALTHLAMHTPAKSIVAMLDLVPHLKDERTLRSLRELIPQFEAHGSTLVLIDASSDLPPSCGQPLLGTI